MSRFLPYDAEQAYLVATQREDELGADHLCFFAGVIDTDTQPWYGHSTSWAMGSRFKQMGSLRVRTFIGGFCLSSSMVANLPIFDQAYHHGDCRRVYTLRNKTYQNTP